MNLAPLPRLRVPTGRSAAVRVAFVGVLALALMVGAGVGPVLAQQQTFMTISTGKLPRPSPTPTGVWIDGVYLGLYYPLNGHPGHPCRRHCRRVWPIPNRPPRPGHPRHARPLASTAHAAPASRPPR